jgi:SAM-dependent methyltransferase
MSPSRTEKIFTRIYTKSSWGDHESKSGAGSGIARTESLRPALTRLARDLEIRSLLDLPCGDFNWMRHTDLPGIDYTGVDIVGSMIERNQAMYIRPGRRFLQLDMLRDPLPRADLILCRDGFVHLSFADTARALRAMHDSGSQYLLATTFTGHPRNREISTGGWRPLNLALEPFCFPAPLCTLADCPQDGSFLGKALALYRFSELSSRLQALERIFLSRKLMPEALRRALGRLRR